MQIPKLVVSDLIAVNDIVDKFPGILEKRRWIQEHRRRPDSAVTKLFLDPFRCAESHPEYEEFQGKLCTLFGITEIFAQE